MDKVTETTETRIEKLNRLREEARGYGIVGRLTVEAFEIAIAEAKAAGQVATSNTVEDTKGLTAEEAAKIDARLKYEEEAREKFRRQRQIKIASEEIRAKSKFLKIKIDLPENPTEFQLAEARLVLGMKEKEIKPSPETLAIESSPRGYYIFTNREQEDASHTVNPGGKYTINLIPDQVHVLSEFHIKFFRQRAVVPIYKRVPVAGPVVEGRMMEECKRTGSKPRFSFEKLDEAPSDAPFGLVTNMKILEELKQEQKQLS